MAHYPDDYEVMQEDTGVSWRQSEKPSKTADNSAVSSPNKYLRQTRGGTSLDVYDVLDAFGVENPAIQHAIKKLLCTGVRGYKDFHVDLNEAIESLERAKAFPPQPF